MTMITMAPRALASRIARRSAAVPSSSRFEFGSASTKTVCDDASSTATTTDDGGDGSSDGSTAIDASCHTETVPAGLCAADGFGTDSAGNITVDATKLANTSAGAVGSGAVVSGLSNNTSYAVAVGATDSFLNVGGVSSLQCAAPELLDDFFETYRRAGGQAGGCAATSAEAPMGSATFLGAVFGMVLVALRRNRKKSR